MPITIDNLISLRGQIRMFGPFGDKCQILKPLYQLNNGEGVMRIKILSTNENIDYRYSKMMSDPLD